MYLTKGGLKPPLYYNKMIGIYKITSPTGRIYIGQSVDIEKRWKYYKRLSCNKQPVIYRSLKKYGVENHTFDILEECSVEELNNREGYWQDFYDVVKNGLNCRRVQTSDNSGYDSEETKRKRSEALKGKKRPSEVIEKMKKPRLNKRGFGNIKSIAVENYTTGAIYGSVQEAAREENIHPTNLIGYLKGDVENPTTLRYLNPELRPKGGNIYFNRRCKIILDTQTGVFYYSLKEAVEYSQFSEDHLSRMLLNKYPNKTTLIYT